VGRVIASGQAEIGVQQITELFALLQNVTDSFISRTSSLEPGRICMITSYSRFASSRTKPMPDARVAR
jgi:hypothetical protein